MYSKHDPVITIGINNPDRKNALDRQIIAELVEALDHLENDETALIGVIYGEFGNFCAGYDLKELSENLESPPEHFTFNVCLRLCCTLISDAFLITCSHKLSLYFDRN